MKQEVTRYTRWQPFKKLSDNNLELQKTKSAHRELKPHLIR
jgi:hypothetical protein